MRKALLVGLLVMMTTVAAYAQGCSVCTKTSSQLSDKGIKGMNSGILYLAAFPLTIIGTLGIIWWKYNKPGR